MKIEKTYKQVLEFSIVADNYLARIAKEHEDNKDYEGTALEKCIELMNKQVRKIMPEFYEKRDLIRLSHCVKDEKTKRLILDESKDYTFTEEGLKQVKEKIKKLEIETVTIHQRILPGNNDFKLTALEKETFAGFVIDEQTDDFEAQFKDDE